MEYRTTTGEQLLTSQAQLQEIQAKYDKLAQPSCPSLYRKSTLAGTACPFGYRGYPTFRLDDVGEELCKLRPHLCPDDEADDT
jgi:hypothetical protein